MKKNFGNLNQQKLFIIVYLQTLTDPMALVFRGSMQAMLKVKSKSNLNERMSVYAWKLILKNKCQVLKKVIHF